MVKPERDQVLQTLRTLRENATVGPLWALQRNEVALWAAQVGLLKDTNNKEAEILTRLQARERAYSATVRQVAGVLTDLCVAYSFIKCFREYPYANTDVNVVVRSQDYDRATEAFIYRGWSTRSSWARMKEWLAERGKRKLLPSSGSKKAEIHLYPCATWHGLKYLDFESIIDYSTSQVRCGTLVIAPDLLMDLLIHYGHCAFERYHLTYGELYHLQMHRFRLGIEGLKRAKQMAQRWGWEKAFTLIDQKIDRWWTSEAASLLPVPLPRLEMYHSWAERSHYHLKKGRLRPACEEILQHVFWSGPMYDVYRLFKRALERGSVNEKVLQ